MEDTIDPRQKHTNNKANFTKQESQALKEVSLSNEHYRPGEKIKDLINNTEYTARIEREIGKLLKKYTDEIPEKDRKKIKTQ